MKKMRMLLLLLVSFCIVVLISDIIPRLKNRYNAEQLKSIMEMEPEETEEQLQTAYSFYYHMNSDAAGWIKIPNTIIDYVMVQCNDNQTYLENDFFGNNSKYGTIFIDAYCRTSQDFEDQNTIIYGHNMKDGQMFGTLKNYRNCDYYQQHPIIETQLASANNAQLWKIFSIFIINANPEQDDGNVFPYRQRSFDSQQDFIIWSEECKNRSLLNIPVDIKPFDQILTLSTCTYEFDEARLVVMARRVRDEESADVGKASINPQPIFPKAYKK